MISLTMQQISDAQANELEAVTAVLREMEHRVANLARKAATGAGGNSASLIEEFEQIGRIAVWESLALFKGVSVAEFFTYMSQRIWSAIEASRVSETRQGVSVAVARDFESALVAVGGDPIAAERHAASSAMGARKMSAEMAHAARLSWSGSLSMDMPGSRSGETLGATLAATLPADLETPKDRESARQRAIKDAVHATLGKMGTKARAILSGTYGIAGPTPYFGDGADAEMASYLGVTTQQIYGQRRNAKVRFRALYLAGATGTPEGLTAE
jgi:hypothetical protein